MYGFDRHPFLRSSNAAPYDAKPTADEMRSAVSQVCCFISLLDNQQLAALFTACEVEHVNRLAQNAGYNEGDMS